MKYSLYFFKTETFDLDDIAFLTYDYYVVKLNSQKVYSLIVDYFMKNDYSE